MKLAIMKFKDSKDSYKGQKFAGKIIIHSFEGRPQKLEDMVNALSKLSLNIHWIVDKEGRINIKLRKYENKW